MTLLRRRRKRRPSHQSRLSRQKRHAVESLESRRVLDSVVVFNELMYHPADNDPRGEWIELRNLLSVDVDLSEWSLRGGVDFEFPQGTAIAADSYLLVVADPEAWANASTAPVVGPFEGALNNAGERVELRNNSDRVMDVIRYDDQSDWPVAADGAGPALAKRDAYWTSSDPTNWEASYTVRGTPGAPNSPDVDLTPQSIPVVRYDATWQYHAAGVDLGTTWHTRTFDDSSWATGRAIFTAGAIQTAPDQLRLTPLDPSGDGDIRGDRTYTHAIDFGNADDGAQINGVQLSQVTSSNITQFDNVQWSHSSGIRTHGKATSVAPLDGPLADIYQDYVSNSLNLADGTAQLVLKHLVPGVRYLTRLHARKADSSPRNVTLEFDDGGTPRSITLDQNAPNIADTDAPYVVEFEFEATSDQLVITATQHDGTKPWYWYGLTNEVVQLTGNTEVAVGPNTHYFRTTFDFLGDMAADHELELRLDVDDGAVVYLNGTEIVRDNMPAGNVSYATSALRDVDSDHQRDPVVLPAAALQINQRNVLAVEIHQAEGGDPDLRFGAELTVIETPRPPIEPPPVLLNELPAAEATDRWVELINDGTQPVDLNQVTLELQGRAPVIVPVPQQTLQPGQAISVPIAVATPWSAGDRVVLYTSDRSAVIDAQTVGDLPRARLWEQEGRWLRPNLPTPGVENQFALIEDLVINEIMYHTPPRYAAEGQTFSETGDEWIELYNRGERAVDLSEWSLSGGVEFHFPRGTVLDPGSYLVVSNNAIRFRELWPGVPVVGDFQGSLSNQGDTVVLEDAVGNPADEVRYFDGGTWPEYADGGGSSLELKDPFADNSQPEAWAASREDDQAPWVEVRYEGRARNPQGSADPTEWNELILGLLDAGEMLIDDISVIEDPEGTALERMRNGTFESGADHWRFVGNHGQHGRTQVVSDPDDPGNHVLHVVATGATEHMSNHLETTFANNARISSSATYRISFRARWIAGSPQLHSRLYFNRLAAVHVLTVPEKTGTPGGPNSRRIANSGPTFQALEHHPVVPDAGQPVTVAVHLADTDGLGEVRLFYAEDGRAFDSVRMQSVEGNRYSGTIPGMPTGRVVQFYVQATDGLGNVSHYPADGVDSRALYRVDDQNATDGPRHNLRIIMTQDDLSEQFTRTNFTSNERMGATVIWQESQVYYDVEVRLKGSGFSRGSNATGFNLRFSPDRLLFGEHDAVSIDRQGGPWGIGASHREMTIKHIANRAGDIPMMYDDVINLIGPRDSVNGSAQFLVAHLAP